MRGPGGCLYVMRNQDFFSTTGIETNSPMEQKARQFEPHADQAWHTATAGPQKQLRAFTDRSRKRENQLRGAHLSRSRSLASPAQVSVFCFCNAMGASPVTWSAITKHICKHIPLVLPLRFSPWVFLSPDPWCVSIIQQLQPVLSFNICWEASYCSFCSQIRENLWHEYYKLPCISTNLPLTS